MAIYVMGEIHGCFKEFASMMKRINAGEKDRILLVGDYIDRGPSSFEMLKWLEKRPKNVFPVKGNHDVDYATYIKILRHLDAREELHTNPDSPEDMKVLYDTAVEITSNPGETELADLMASIDDFDKFGTIAEIMKKHKATLRQFNDWAFMLASYPYYYRFKYKEKEIVVVHAGYAPAVTDIPGKYHGLEDFYLHAREESIRFGGFEGGIVVAGHTPTIAKKMYCFTEGRIFKHINEDKNCTFYNVDCGCAYREVTPYGRMCCLRIDDEVVYYGD